MAKLPDLGKMYGPLPLGAWIVVVGVGGGIAYWNYRSSAGGSGDEPIEVEDGSGQPGVGTGAVGGWTPTVPGPSDQGLPEQAVTTNDQWAVRAINSLIASNYPAGLADSAIRKYISGTQTSVTEYALVQIALARWGSPPQPLPPDEGPPPSTPPPSGGNPMPGAPVYITVSKDFAWGEVVNWVRSRTNLDPQNKLNFAKIYLFNPTILSKTYVSKYGVRRMKATTRVRIA
jgi:hypothetical protein